MSSSYFSISVSEYFRDEVKDFSDNVCLRSIREMNRRPSSYYGLGVFSVPTNALDYSKGRGED
jgi:hypothetical protein